MGERRYVFTKNLEPGMLVFHTSWDLRTSDPMEVIKKDGEILLKDLDSGEKTSILKEEEEGQWLVYREADKKKKKREKKKGIVLGCIMWGCSEDFPIEELKDFVNKWNVKDVNEIDMGSSDYILILTSKKVSEKEAYKLFNEEMREMRGDDWTDIEYEEN
jgi:hypothetical protein